MGFLALLLDIHSLIAFTRASFSVPTNLFQFSETDFAGLLKVDVYFGIQDLSKLENIVRRNNIKLTAFVTGKILEDNPEILPSLVSINAEIECHSYSHRLGHGSKLEDIEEGTKSFEKLFGNLPLGYRAPQGIITKKEAIFLGRKGIKFDLLLRNDLCVKHRIC